MAIIDFLRSYHNYLVKKVFSPNIRSESSTIITIDVEDWFQVENFKDCIQFSDWTCQELRVEKNTYSLLEFFDVFNIKGTFFILGWIAERFPALVKEIHSLGHEVASHGYNHNLCSQQAINDLKKDLSESKKLLEDIIGSPVHGYRAPGFSINYHALKLVEDCGFFYDSSFNSFRLNRRYGQVDLRHNKYNGIAYQISDFLYELPISNLKLYNFILPWGGGGYFRLIPYPIFRIGVQHILKAQQAYLFYLHPWEIDPEQSVVKRAPGLLRFRHYINLKKTFSKLSSLIETLKGCRFIPCRKYLEEKLNE